MATKFKIFDVETDRALDKNRMFLPDRAFEPQLVVDNHDYERVRASWRDTKAALDYEFAFMKRLEEAADLQSELTQVLDEEYEDFDSPLRCFDLGVASVVLALAAMGCHPYASCNGGCFGDFHHYGTPLVAFFAKPEHAGALLRAAEASGAFIGHDEMGLAVWVSNIWHMHAFAKALVEDHDVRRGKRKR